MKTTTAINPKPQNFVSVYRKEGLDALTLKPEVGLRWLLPWSNLLYATFNFEAGDEVIELTFTAHVVRVMGIRLRSLFELMGKSEVGLIEAHGKRYRTLAAEDEAYVDSITVLERTSDFSNQTEQAEA